MLLEHEQHLLLRLDALSLIACVQVQPFSEMKVPWERLQSFAVPAASMTVIQLQQDSSRHVAVPR